MRCSQKTLLFFLFIILTGFVAQAGSKKKDFKDLLLSGPKEVGCCKPLCKEMSKGYCDLFPEGRWSKLNCQQDPECDQGCCSPWCTGLSKDICLSMSSDSKWHNKDCKEVNECEMGCCTPYCVDVTEQFCSTMATGHGIDRKWKKGEACDENDKCSQGCCVDYCQESTEQVCKVMEGKDWRDVKKCDEVEDCQNTCCQPMNKEMLGIQCKMLKGTPEPGPCPGMHTYMRTKQRSTGGGDYGHGIYEFIVDVSTCEKHVYGKWTGKWVWKWTYVNPMGNQVTTPTSGLITFTPSSGGSFSFSMGDPKWPRTNGVVTPGHMKVFFNAPGIVGKVEASGNIKKGGGAGCNSGS